MKIDHCVPQGTPAPREPETYLGYTVAYDWEAKCWWFHKPGQVSRDAKSKADAHAKIYRLVHGEPKSSGRVADEGPQTYRIGRDIASREASRKIVEAKEKRDA